MHGNRTHLADFLRESAFGEQQLEGCREQLVRSATFDPMQCFQLIDARAAGCLAGLDLRLFLARHKVHISPEEAHRLAKAMGADSSGRVSFSSFLSFILPANRWEREKAIKKEGFSMNFQGEYALVRLLEREIDLQRQLCPLSKEVTGTTSLLEAFRTLEESGNYSYWTAEAVRGFAEEQGFVLDSEGVKGVFRRLDRNRDGKIDYADFVDAMTGSESHMTAVSDVSLAASLPRVAALPLRQNRSKDHSSPPKPSPYTPTKSTTIPVKISESQAQRLDRFALSRPLRLPPETDRNIPKVQDDLNDRVPMESVRLSARSEPVKDMHTSDLTAFCIYLKEQLRLLQALEKSRQDLAMCQNFHISSGFSFLSKGSRRISLPDFCLSLRKLGISASESTFQHLFHFYDHNNDQELDLTEFSDMVQPQSYELSSLMHRRPVTNLDAETVGYLRRVMERLVEYEEFVDRAGRRLEREVEVRKVFERLDGSGLGYFTRKGLEDFLGREKIRATEEEISALFKRYDLNSNSRVPYSEFLRAISHH